jgi:hypothetical protein
MCAGFGLSDAKFIYRIAIQYVPLFHLHEAVESQKYS